jgi:hypothetical protein
MSHPPRSSPPPGFHHYHILDSPESDIGLGISTDAWPRQDILFRPLVKDTSSAAVNFARPLQLAPRVELDQIELGGLQGNIRSIRE